MYDFIKIFSNIFDRHKYVEKEELGLETSVPHFTGEVKNKSVNRKYRNCKLSVYTDKLVLAGSIQKFYHGNNYSGFNRSQLIMACEAISENLKIKEKDLKVTKLEASVTVKSKSIYPYFDSMKGSYPFHDMRKGNILYGVFAFTGKEKYGDYGIKCYDKSEQLKLQEDAVIQDPLQQFELCIERMRWFNVKYPLTPINNLTDLYKLPVMENVKKEMLAAFDSIHFKNKSLNYSKLLTAGYTPKEICKIEAYQNLNLREHFKTYNWETYKKDTKFIKPILSDPQFFLCHGELDCFKKLLVSSLDFIIEN